MTLLKDDSDSLSIASSCLKKGGVAILPTDTVYGFSGIVDLKNGKVFNTDEKIKTIKGRAENKALIQLISNPEDIYKYTDDLIPEKVLSKWPGPLTVIVNLKKDSPIAVDLATVAFRCPGDLWLRNLIKECGSPIYSTSVNRSGCPVLRDIPSIKKEFSREVDLIVEGNCKGDALPSTIISLEKDGSIKVLRQGAVNIN